LKHFDNSSWSHQDPFIKTESEPPIGFAFSKHIQLADPAM